MRVFQSLVCENPLDVNLLKEKVLFDTGISVTLEKGPIRIDHRIDHRIVNALMYYDFKFKHSHTSVVYVKCEYSFKDV